MRKSKVSLTDDQVRGLLGKLGDAAEKAGPMALKKWQAAHAKGECNCNHVRREIADAFLPFILKMNSGQSAEMLAMLLAQMTLAKVQSQAAHNDVLNKLMGLLGGLAKGNQPPVEGDEWKSNR